MASIPVEQLKEYLPHREPMIWVNHIHSYGSDGGTGSALLRPDGSYMTAEEFRRPSMVELIAQTYAYSQAAHWRSLGQESIPLRTLLVGVKNFTFTVGEEISANEELLIKVKRHRTLGPISFIHGEIFRDERLLARGEIKVFHQAL